MSRQECPHFLFKTSASSDEKTFVPQGKGNLQVIAQEMKDLVLVSSFSLSFSLSWQILIRVEELATGKNSSSSNNNTYNSYS